ncbi:hypothetical protein HaLaN_04123 [Haematococcus lacustris]|uniref:Uncharacterized protein n=1 Tax=Haematococcus lacustris TaxID=44745 RepID=A0A699Z119_HAELA|nr:hypothetical protein HaLaN_04123 [Haematococcus lacustris]
MYENPAVLVWGRSSLAGLAALLRLMSGEVEVQAKPVRVNELDSQYLLVSIPMVQRWTATSSLSSVLRMVGMPTVLTLSITANLVVDAATERVVSQRDEISFAQPPTSADFGSRSSRPRVLPSWVRATLGLPVPLVSTVLGA